MKKVEKIVNEILNNRIINNTGYGILIYRLFLDLIFVLFISKIFDYESFGLHFVFYKYIISWIFVVISIKYIDKMSLDSFSNKIIFLIYILYFIPLSTLYGLNNLPDMFYFLSCIYFACLYFYNSKIKYICFKGLGGNKRDLIFNILSIVVPIFVFIISYIYTGFRLNFNFIDVYDIRFEASKYTIPKIIEYIFYSIDIVIPVLLLYSFEKKKYYHSALLIFTQFVVFSFSAQKSTFAILLIVLFCYFLRKKGLLKYTAYILMFVFVFCIVEKIFLGSNNFISLLYRRNLLLPPSISSKYFVFFQNNPIALFTNSFVGKLGFTQIYPMDVARILGNFYDSAETSLNNGLVGDALANLGYIGVVIMPLILVIVFRLMDAVTYNKKENIVLCFVIYFVMKYINGSWSIILLSGGYLVVVLLMYIFPVNEKSKCKTFDYKLFINSLKINLKKFVIYVLSITIVGTLCGLYFSQKKYEPIEYKPIEIKEPHNEKLYYMYYIDLFLSSKEIIKELDNFTSYFEMTELFNDVNKMKEIEEDLMQYNFIYRLVDNKLVIYNKVGKLYYENNELFIDNNINFQFYFEPYKDGINELYSIISRTSENILNMKSDARIIYQEQNGVIRNYNIYIISKYDYIPNALIICTLIFFGTGIVSGIYIFGTKDMYNKNKK